MRVLNDEEMVKAITEKPNIPMGQALIESQFQSDIKGFIELLSASEYEVGLVGQGNFYAVHESVLESLKQLVEVTNGL